MAIQRGRRCTSAQDLGQPLQPAEAQRPQATPVRDRAVAEMGRMPEGRAPAPAPTPERQRDLESGRGRP